MTIHTATALAQAASQLRAAAVAHKRSAAAHRRFAREAARAFDDIVDSARRLGIQLDIDTRFQEERSDTDR